MMRRIAIGCFAIVAVVFLCGTATVAGLYISSSRLMPPLPEAPVAVDGDCPREAVMAYAGKGRTARFERIMAPVDAMNGSGDMNETANRLQRIDVAAMRAERDAILAQPVPACLEEVRAAEVDLANLAINVVDDVQGATRDGMGLRGTWVAITGVVALVRGVAPRLERVKAGWEVLGARMGVDFEALEPAPTPESGSEGG